MLFLLHFSPHSGGLPQYYQYINISEHTRYDPSSKSYWENEICLTQTLANDVCNSALQLLTIKENN